jgi:hypothetical protein
MVKIVVDGQEERIDVSLVGKLSLDDLQELLDYLTCCIDTCNELKALIGNAKCSNSISILLGLASFEQLEKTNNAELTFYTSLREKVLGTIDKNNLTASVESWEDFLANSD